ncbi:squalene/phytoene synthase family protein [Actibacterium sp. MT2.3-13A]|uniref:phytoene/squalene synthase family protein n=1 Tax=Actibacterium sp. MT2.3-13A TaxID=2828332 RepID=UPI001BAE316D|nr:squalene/phytoene synthase family protein [Actibacterium sp. MT2.3-13A]
MSIQACAELVQRGDPDRFLATMAAPVAARARLFPLYAFNLEVARAPWASAEPMIAEMRLQWWRDALAEIGQGGPARRHEVVTPLADLLDAQDAARLDALVEARRWDIYRDPFADFAAFEAHIDATAGHLMWTAARLLGADSGEGVLRDFAHAAGVANWLQAIPELEARGRVPLVDGRAEAVAELARAALGRLGRARGRRAELPRTAAPALLAGWQAEGVLRRAAADPARVAEGRLAPSEFRRRGGLLWKGFTGRW